MPEQNGDEKKDKNVRELEDLEEKYWDIHKSIVRTIKERERVEREYLAVIKKQMEYWEGQLNKTDPIKDKKRYNELKERIEVEKSLIKQIDEELVRIKEELKLEREHEKKITHPKNDK